MKKPDMLVLITVWNFLSAGLMTIGFAAVLIFAMPFIKELDGIAYTGAMFGVVVGLILLGAFIILSFIAGLGLAGEKEWGRVTAVAQAALCLISVPIGTVIGLLIITYLGKPEVRDYYQKLNET